MTRYRTGGTEPLLDDASGLRRINAAGFADPHGRVVQ